ncbi:MAG: serine hydrolase domain-containing protein [bacterium]
MPLYLYASIVVTLLMGCTAHPNPDEKKGAVDPRAAFVASLFTGVEQYRTFNRLKDIFPHHTISASPNPFEFSRGNPISLPTTYVYHGEVRNVTRFLDETRTVALLVIKDGNIRYENYWLTGGPDVNWMSMSVGKSFVSALVGIAIDNGLIRSVQDPITDYVPELLGSAYDNVSIRDVLQMSSGARWNEDYSDPDSDIMRYGEVFAGGGSLDDFTASLVRERQPGTYNYYNSTDTQALGMLLVRATGQSMAAYAQAELWHPLGMANEAYWITDNHGTEMAAGGLQVTARDYAKLGQLYLQKGNWQGRQIVSEQWIADSLTADAPHLQAQANPEYPVGYGYQWWLPVSETGEFSAIGVYNQFIFVNPAKNSVIVKLSANPGYGLTNDESSFRELETFEMLRAVNARL